MKWLLIARKSGQEIYELRNAEEKLLSVTIQQRSGSLRITTNDEKRVFLVRKQGFLRSRTVLQNEYGIRIGQLSYDNTFTTGIIEFDNEKFNYSLQNGLLRELTIKRNEEIIANCELPAVSDNNFHNDLLVLALGWYLISFVNKQVEEYA